MAANHHDHANDQHVPGTMDYSAQANTFASFLRFTQWSVGIIIVVLIFLALAGA